MSFSALRRRAVNASRNYLHREWDFQALLNFDEVPPFVRRHLVQVYLCLLGASVSFALGCYFCPDLTSERLFTIFATFVIIFCLCKTAPWQENRRVCLLLTGAFFGGASFAPWFTWLLGVDTGPLVLMGLLSASAVFGGDSAHWKFQLHAGLLWFMVYVAVYSQEVVQKARSGDVDYVKHAITLITDLPAVVVHVCDEIT
ncbi:Bax inhibitor 1 [Sesamum angolense]|uniref:Bax inhibitor 1 n=1 Tax=Sesamum angolense TaxID=2727404 RepID=A0AAE1XFR9_9LAMI|nr:Bax inhibitor 1 [Sesamum angolense]